MEELINKENLENLICQIVSKQLKQSNIEVLEDNKVIGFTEFQSKYLPQHGKGWIRLNIFDKFPEVDIENGGFVINPRGQGKKTWIYEKQACQWLSKHIYDIDWNA